MPRFLAPIVHYTDAQWRALRTKAKNNHPSLRPQDIETINEVVRVNEAIVKETDPTPLPHLANSINFDESQVIKFFLWETVEEHGSTFNLIRTFVLPKRRGGKNQKPASPVLKPRRSPMGNTNGFVRPSRKLEVVLKMNDGTPNWPKGENGEERMDGIVNDNVNDDAITSGSLAGKKNKRGPMSVPSDNFVRRSSRRVGGSIEKIDGLVVDEVTSEAKDQGGSSSLGGSSIGEEMVIDTLAANRSNSLSKTASSLIKKNSGMGVNEQGGMDGVMGQVQDRPASRVISDLIFGENKMSNSPPATANGTNSGNDTKNVRPWKPKIKLLLASETRTANRRNNARSAEANSIPPSSTPRPAPIMPPRRFRAVPVLPPPMDSGGNLEKFNVCASSPSSSFIPRSTPPANHTNNAGPSELNSDLPPSAPRVEPMLPLTMTSANIPDNPNVRSPSSPSFMSFRTTRAPPLHPPRTPPANNPNNAHRSLSPSFIYPSTPLADNTNDARSSIFTAFLPPITPWVMPFPPPNTPSADSANSRPSLFTSFNLPTTLSAYNTTIARPSPRSSSIPPNTPLGPRHSPLNTPCKSSTSSTNTAPSPSLPPLNLPSSTRTGDVYSSPHQALTPSNLRHLVPDNDIETASNTLAGNNTNHMGSSSSSPLNPPTTPYISPYGYTSIPNAMKPIRRGSNSSISAPPTQEQFFHPEGEERGNAGNVEMQRTPTMDPPVHSESEMSPTNCSEPFEEPLDLLQMAVTTPRIGERLRSPRVPSSPVYEPLDEMEMDW